MMQFTLIFLSDWREFPSGLALHEKKKIDDGSRLDVVEIAGASSDMRPFNPYNKKRLAIPHIDRPLFLTTLSVPRHWEVGRAKDLSAPLLHLMCRWCLYRKVMCCG